MKRTLGVIMLTLSFQKDPSASQEFMTAVTQGDAVKVKQMLTADPKIAQAKDDRGGSAILKATYYGKKDMVALLLTSGLELNIFEAAATGQTVRLRVLVKTDPAKVNAFSTDGFTPLGLAVFFGHTQGVDALLAAGADVNVPSRESMRVSPLHSAVAGRQLAIAKVLIAHGANVKAVAETAFTPLHEAAATGQIEFARLLLEHGAEIHATTQEGKTPLALALERKQSEMAAFLRAQGALR